MGLQSKLFRGDPKLEACLVADSAHVTPGSRGDHVAKIQMALNELSQARLAVDGIYGPATANAVKAYKNHPSRRILQPWQTTADNVVGKRTIASLDREMLLTETAPGRPFRIYAVYPIARASGPAPAIHRSAVTLGSNLPASFSDPAPRGNATPPLPSQVVRLEPREVGRLSVEGTRGNAFVHCTNHPPKGGNCREKVTWLWDPAKQVGDRLSPEPVGPTIVASGEVAGGKLILTDDPHALNIDGFRPGDATIDGANSIGAKYSVRVEVRARSAGAVKGAPLTKLEPGSKFFSASEKNGGEHDPHSVFSGRPVNPRPGGRWINLGGEQETPGFDDYQVSLAFSGYKRRFFSGNKFVFRPLVNDTDRSVRVADKSASHICMRGSPLTDEFIDAIKRIAQPGCLFTFSGSLTDAQKAKQMLSGTALEEDLGDGKIVIQLRA